MSAQLGHELIPELATKSQVEELQVEMLEFKQIYIQSQIIDTNITIGSAEDAGLKAYLQKRNEELALELSDVVSELNELKEVGL